MIVEDVTTSGGSVIETIKILKNQPKVKSKPNEGTQFIVSLPVKQV